MNTWPRVISILSRWNYRRQFKKNDGSSTSRESMMPQESDTPKSPNHIAKLESNLLPLHLRRKICFSKFISKKNNSPKEHLARKFIKNWVPNQRLKCRTPLNMAHNSNLLAIPINPIHRTFYPPHRTLNKLTCFPHLSANSHKHKTQPELLKTLALQIIEENSSLFDITIYTDSSQLETGLSGSGIAIYKDKKLHPCWSQARMKKEEGEHTTRSITFKKSRMWLVSCRPLPHTYPVCSQKNIPLRVCPPGPQVFTHKHSDFVAANAAAGNNNGYNRWAPEYYDPGYPGHYYQPRQMYQPQEPLYYPPPREKLRFHFWFFKNKTLVSYVPKIGITVTLLSTKHSTTTIDQETAEQQKPEIITFYNMTKGDVDVVDQKCAMYSVGRRTKRWPLCLFLNFFDVVAINSAVIYKVVNQDGGMA
ncbi:hypothetical protein LAZ67_22000699 [Cordylochernes scorpioides]|uniref:PiggyBac transposable element-derived protein domain-containing protein n=1 Tax=Cordylochernes scorpioides TaxID=51811 RepID=A0ABY6LSC5_9ARAC|nr:hypothetical protein LAZ67_22000699 [Cordylochernes scorpioides]